MSSVTSIDQRGPVVVGVSGSPESDRAVDWGADFAAASHRPLLLVHTVGHGEVRPSAEDVAETEQAAAEAGRPVVDAALRRAAARQPDLSVSGAVEVGDPPSVLLAHTSRATAVVVGSRGGGAGHLLGSVSLAVARQARCPAVVVRPSGEGDPGRLGERVVLGVDGSPGSRAAAEFAFAYADLTGLPLVVLHGSWERLARGSAVLRLLGGTEEHGPTEEERLTIAETVAGLPERFPDVEVRDAHRSTDPAKALIEASESARLVVVGGRHHGLAGSLLLRSVGTSLVEHAHCPVAVVHAQDVAGG
jgi:nucleotide-binding universal stress UspA family protein